MRLLQLKLGNKILSAERSQRALSPYCCEEISKGIFHINLSALNNDYVIKIDEKENEYFSTELSDAFETVKLWFTIVFIYSFLFSVKLGSKNIEHLSFNVPTLFERHFSYINISERYCKYF